MTHRLKKQLKRVTRERDAYRAELEGWRDCLVDGIFDPEDILMNVEACLAGKLDYKTRWTDPWEEFNKLEQEYRDKLVENGDDTPKILETLRILHGSRRLLRAGHGVQMSNLYQRRDVMGPIEFVNFWRVGYRA